MGKDPILQAIKDLTSYYENLGSRLIAVEVVCAKLIQESARVQTMPSDHILRVTSELRGTADAIALKGALPGLKNNPSGITNAIERICFMAEDAS
jgi:hypothetical protein